VSATGAAGTVHGGLVGVIGGLLIGVAYVAFPAGMSPGGGPLTAPQLGDLVVMVGTPSLALLSAVPILAAVIVSIGGWLRVVKPVDQAGRVGGIALLGCAGLVVVIYVFPLVQVLAAMGMPLALSFTASGFWLTMLGMTLTAGGGCLQLSGSRAPRAQSGP
jgi:hypothetical protein